MNKALIIITLFLLLTGCQAPGMFHKKTFPGSGEVVHQHGGTQQMIEIEQYMHKKDGTMEYTSKMTIGPS